ncbi:MAG: ROK family protein [Pseudomonadota bacterium]
MTRFAVIRYSSDGLQASYLELPSVEKRELQGATRDIREDVRKAAEKNLKIVPVDIDASREIISDAIKEIVDFIVTDLKDDEIFTTIIGYGPVSDRATSNKTYGYVHDLADPPFSGISVHNEISRIVVEKTSNGMNIDRVRLISDCAALATARLWSTFQFGQPNIAAIGGMIFGRGVGGAVASRLNMGKAVCTFSEYGHITVHEPENEILSGPNCEFHSGCLTGRASWRALFERAEILGVPIEHLVQQPQHEIWELQADYMAQGCFNMFLAHRPNCIVLGGSILKKAPFLFGKCIERFHHWLGDDRDFFGIGTSSQFLQLLYEDEAYLQGGLRHSTGLWVYEVREFPYVQNNQGSFK